MSPKSLLCWTQPASAIGVGSMVSNPSRWRAARASLTHSTCCSIDTTMFDSTDGLPGPVIMNRLGNPTVVSPR